MTYHSKVIAGGKMVLPADLRREFGIKDGDTLVVERHDGGMTVKTYAQVVSEVQAEVRALTGAYRGSMVDDLLTERRREAAREDEQDEYDRRASNA